MTITSTADARSRRATERARAAAVHEALEDEIVRLNAAIRDGATVVLPTAFGPHEVDHVKDDLWVVTHPAGLSRGASGDRSFALANDGTWAELLDQADVARHPLFAKQEGRSTTMITTTPRRCIGSTRFGIEPHEAPVGDFPIQPSRKDGLGLMCRPHWRAYVKGLREARMARTGASVTAHNRASDELAAKPARQPRKRAPIEAHMLPPILTRKATTKRERRRTPMAHIPSAKAGEVERAEALIAQVDALPAPEMVSRVGDDDVQAALEVVANVAETTLGESLDGGTEEAHTA